MAAWELALVIMALTFMVVNMVNLAIQVIYLVSMKGFIVKSAKLMEKLMGISEKYFDEMIKDLDEDESH